MILALDTSSAQGGLAVLDPATGAQLHSAVFHSDRSHNVSLFAPLEEALAVLPAPLSLLVVGTGPGSYGGVRSGISAILGLALGRGCPALGIPSLVTLAPDALVVGDARRSSFFAAEIRDHQLVGSLQVLDAAALQRAVHHATLPVLTMDSEPPLGLASIEPRLPSAACLASLALRMTEVELTAALARPLEPLYVRPPFITEAKPRRSAS